MSYEPHDLAVTVDVLYTMMHNWDNDSDEFADLERVLKIAASELKAFAEVHPAAVLVELPHSEVCMHMNVAGTLMWVYDLGHRMAQLYTLEGERFSLPITHGKAGLLDGSVVV